MEEPEIVEPILSDDKIRRHPALLGVFQMELVDYADVLTFESEHQLTTEPLRIDVLIVKKKNNVEIKKNIGAIFRKCNIIEYKGPEDYISISDFYKTYGYAMMYLSLEKDVEVTDITLTIDAKAYPAKLIEHLRNVRGYEVTEEYPGIYYVTGDIIPIQIIESKKLLEEDNLWLRSLDNEVKIETIETLFAKARIQRLAIDLEAFMDVVVQANMQVIQEEAKNMNPTTAATIGEIVDTWEKRGFVPEFIRLREERAKLESAKAMLDDGIPIETVSRILKFPIDKIQEFQSAAAQ